MKQFLSWMRQVLPRDTIIGTAVGIDLMLELIQLFSIWRFGVANEEDFRIARLLAQTVAVVLFGCHRVSTFHPAANEEYRRWLELSPWTASKPLPMGPVHLVPQDLVVITASMMLTRVWDARVLYIPTLFLSFYALSLAATVWITGQKLMAYGIAISLTLVILTIQRPEVAIIFALMTLLMTPLAIHRTLRTYPWNLPWYADGRQFTQVLDEWKQDRIGWPFDIFAPKSPKVRIPLIDGFGISIVVGCWFSVIYLQVTQETSAAMLGGLGFVLFASTILRLGDYMRNHHPPISFMGRIATLRPWRSGFDQILLAPLLADAVGLTGMILTMLVRERVLIQVWGMGILLPGWFELPVVAATVTFSLLVMLSGGPNLDAWRLCGRHRVVFNDGGAQAGLGGSQKNQDFVQTA